MSLEDRSQNPSFEDAQGTRSNPPITQVDQALARARYEQSHPAKSSQGNYTESLFSGPSGLQDESSIYGGMSTYSYDSTRDLSAYFRDIDGRRFLNQESTYMLPTDESEFWRLDKQHAAMLVALGNLYACPDLVESVLAPREGESIEIADIGCGTGTWAISMARRFPHTQVVGIDIAPVPINPDQLPPNVQFELDDINSGLPRHGGKFNLVHMRCVGGGLPDYAQGITYAAQCLKPGGLLLIVEFDMSFYAEDMVSSQKMATPNQPTGSWLQRYFYEFRWAYALNGTDIFQAEEMLDHGLWGHSLLDACGAGSVFLPIGPWPQSSDSEESQRLRFSGILVKQNFKKILHSFQIGMKKNGIPQPVLDEWVRNCEQELESLNIHSWQRLRLLWGKRNGVDPPLGPTASSPTGAETGSNSLDLSPSTWVPHKQIHIYHTLEDAQKARKQKVDTIGEVAEPAALKPT
ncbi:hypothetical protein M408DRAFT_204068 [Serendipita vermifera MAFF 305830]|uniref:Methyltransferase domain-containing protein n=1 Tax=Serendipita vermifera MAFF 305830 TaxID=933852 RepID=A0A0C3AMG8_SERVB|nr:hypothetical protein M408DRAFT_204068 [Serendipita vermifera MAFF 305830]